MAAHRHWRLYITAPATAYINVGELEFHETVGGADVLAGGTASASSEYPGFPAANAVDDTIVSAWSAGAGPPTWWAYDFGLGVAKDIIEIKMYPRQGWTSRTPTEFDMQYSDDGTNWTTSFSVSITWSSEVWQTFPPPPPPANDPGGHRYWRCCMEYGVQGRDLLSFGTLKMLGSDGINRCGWGTPAASSSYSGWPVANCFDDGTGTCWVSNDNAPGWISYDFGLGKAYDITQIYAYTSQYTFRNPTEMIVQWSDDNSAWNDAWYITDWTWTTSQLWAKTTSFDIAAAHRYWRYWMTANAASSYPEIAETEMRIVVGGANQCGSGTASAMLNGDSWNTPAKGSDGSVTSFYAGYVGLALPQWWAYDFGSGMAKAIIEITLSSDSNNYGTESRLPTAFLIQASDDGVVWFNIAEETASAWSNNQTQTFIFGAPPTNNQNDGTSSGGLGFGGTVAEVGTTIYNDEESSGGLAFGGVGDISTPVNIQSDGISSGGLAFGGAVAEQWTNPWMVAIKGGTYRIAGVIYSLSNTMTYPGLGDIAALILTTAPPATPGLWRYDLLSIDAAGTITLTGGAEAAVPVMPATPANQVKLDHILRYYGQTSVVQTDIGKLYQAPALTRITAAASDTDLAWGELTSTITVQIFDQYGRPYTGGATINASIISGNGTIAPASQSTGGSSSAAFTYTRGGNDPGDQSPYLQFSSQAGPMATIFIILRNVAGDIMT